MSAFFLQRVVLIVSAVFFATPAWGLDLSQWPYRAAVTIESADHPYARLTLAAPVYNACRDDLADIRLTSADLKQIPFVLFQPHDQTQKTDYTLETLNRVTTADQAAMLTVDFGRPTMKTDIAVETSGQNFRRAVRIEGSNDNREFFILVDKAYVFAIDANGASHRYSTIQLPRNDYHYLRIRVAPMPNEEQLLAIQSVKAWQSENIAVPSKTLDIALLKVEQDADKKANTFYYDSQFNNLPLVSLKPAVADEAFYRWVTVEGRDRNERMIEIPGEDNRPRYRREEVPWRHLTSGVIYRYKSRDGSTLESLSLSLPAASSPRYIRLIIKNYDDQPLTITHLQARMIPHELVFPRPAGAECFLYAGNASASSPQYDLRHTLTNPAGVIASPAVIASVIEDNPLFASAAPAAIPWTEEHKVLFWSILVLIVLILMGFIVKSLKSLLTASHPGGNSSDR